MKITIKNFIFLSFLLYNVCCHAQQPMLDTFIQVLEKKSIYAQDVNWKKLKGEFQKKELINSSDSSNQLIEAVQNIYKKLNDRHGSFFYKGKIYKGNFNDSFSASDSLLLSYAMDEKYALKAVIFEGRYAYISIPSPSIPNTLFENEVEATKVISSMGKQLQTLYLSSINPQIEGIIVDFRLSLGGAYPIIASSLAPILGNGRLFTMESKDSTDKIYVELINGNLYENGKLIAQTNYNGQALGVKVAILLGPLTSSSAEQSALAFKGRKNVKYIGENTAGFLSMTSLHTFPDGNYFTYSSKFLRANDKKVYPYFLRPDIVIKEGNNFEDLQADRKVIEALKWFKGIE